MFAGNWLFSGLSFWFDAFFCVHPLLVWLYLPKQQSVSGKRTQNRASYHRSSSTFPRVQINVHLLERHQVVLLTLYSSGIYIPEVTYPLLRSATVVVVEPFSGNVPFLVSVSLLIGQ